MVLPTRLCSRALTDHLLCLDPENTGVKNLRAGALIALDKARKNPNARHYYLTCAAELQQDLDMDKRATGNHYHGV